MTYSEPFKERPKQSSATKTLQHAVPLILVGCISTILFSSYIVSGLMSTAFIRMGMSAFMGNAYLQQQAFAKKRNDNVGSSNQNQAEPITQLGPPAGSTNSSDNSSASLSKESNQCPKWFINYPIPTYSTSIPGSRINQLSSNQTQAGSGNLSGNGLTGTRARDASNTSNIHFTPIVPFFMPPNVLSNVSGLSLAKAQLSTNASSPPPGLPAKVLQSLANAPTNALSKPTTQGFLSKGTINSLIRTPTSSWIATGNWSMTVDNGSLTGFTTNMTWFNSNGKTSHTHEFRNLRAGTETMNGNNIVISGLMDVGTNHLVVWKAVPTTIRIQGGKTLIVSVDDNATNHHFAGQPVFGIVTSFVPCSDVPSANMEVLPSCQK